jgi:hypothetical protein
VTAALCDCCVVRLLRCVTAALCATAALASQMRDREGVAEERPAHLRVALPRAEGALSPRAQVNLLSARGKGGGSFRGAQVSDSPRDVLPVPPSTPSPRAPLAPLRGHWSPTRSGHDSEHAEADNSTSRGRAGGGGGRSGGDGGGRSGGSPPRSPRTSGRHKRHVPPDDDNVGHEEEEEKGEYMGQDVDGHGRRLHDTEADGTPRPTVVAQEWWRRLRREVEEAGNCYCRLVRSLRSAGPGSLPVRTQAKLTKVLCADAHAVDTTNRAGCLHDKPLCHRARCSNAVNQLWDRSLLCLADSVVRWLVLCIVLCTVCGPCVAACGGNTVLVHRGSPSGAPR